MKKESEYIKDFFDFLRQTDSDINVAKSILQDMENETQDILHHIELNECTPYDFICLGIALKQIRQTRRKAKDKLTILMPIQVWKQDNQREIRELERLLGEMRKEEKKALRRSYRMRTDAVERALKDGGE